MRIRAFSSALACLAVVMGAGAIAGQPSETVAAKESAEAQPVHLWRDLSLGQSVTEVSTQLAAYSEIKSIKAKPPKKGKAPGLKVAMKDGGIPVYGSAFSLAPKFDVAGKLSDVSLISEPECANEAVSKFQRIHDALSEKYGKEATGREPLDSYAASSALMKSYRSEQPEVLAYGFANEKVAVAFVLGFSKAKPPLFVGGGSFARALHAVAEGLYDGQKAKCRNSGDETVTYAIRYLSREQFDDQVEAIDARREAEDEEAGDNL